jgi:glutamate-1-semialdehyde 2,1-aminomutase
MAAGIPAAIAELTVKFRYNNVDSIRDLFRDHPGKIACIILEAATIVEPRPGFLQAAKGLCHEHGALFILDEIITGFRYHLNGAQAKYGVVPDLCCFGKAMGNGFAISALLGRRDVMDLGGILHDKERVFLLSTTFGAETHCLAAALKTMEIYEREGVVEVLWRQGERLRRGVEQAIVANDIVGNFRIAGLPCNLLHVSLDADGEPSQAHRTLFLQELIRNGVLAPSFVVSYAHGDTEIDRTVEAVDASLKVLRRGLEDGVEKYLTGPPSKPVWRQFN